MTGSYAQHVDDEAPPVHEDRDDAGWGSLADYVLPEELRRTFVSVGVGVSAPRDLIDASLRHGTPTIEFGVDSYSATVERGTEGSLVATHVHIGRVLRLGGVGAELSSIVGWRRQPDVGSDADSFSFGASVYGRVGASRGLHARVAIGVQGVANPSGQNVVVHAAFQIPLIRHRIAELDLVGRMVGSLGENTFLLGIVELRTLLARCFALGVGWRTNAIGVSVGWAFE